MTYGRADVYTANLFSFFLYSKSFFSFDVEAPVEGANRLSPSSIPDFDVDGFFKGLTFDPQPFPQRRRSAKALLSVGNLLVEKINITTGTAQMLPDEVVKA